MATSMELLRKLFWFAVFLLSTLCFVVLFEKGTTNFVPNLQKQIQEVVQVVKEQIAPAKKEKP